MKQKQTASLEDARRVIAAGEESARELGQPMNIAVVDAGGNLIAHERMDGAWIGSIDISINKAFTARAFDLATEASGAQRPAGQPVLRHPRVQRRSHHDLRRRRAADPCGEVVGAVGVSGGDGKQDQAVAEAAASAF